MAYPNPFDRNLTLVYNLPSEEKVSLKLFSVSGQLIAELVPETIQQAGQHQVVYNAETNAAAKGIYLLKFDTEEYSETIKLVKIAD